MAQFEISRCVPADLDAMVDVYIKAFTNTYMNTILFPPQTVTHDSIRTWLSHRFHKYMTRPHPEMHCFKVTETATRKVAAWARWGYPFTLTEEEKAVRDAEKAQDEAEKASGVATRFPLGSNEEACVEFFGALDVMREKYMKWDEDYS
jgi:hypothetical protein